MVTIMGRVRSGGSEADMAEATEPPSCYRGRRRNGCNRVGRRAIGRALISAAICRAHFGDRAARFGRSYTFPCDPTRMEMLRGSVPRACGAGAQARRPSDALTRRFDADNVRGFPLKI